MSLVHAARQKDPTRGPTHGHRPPPAQGTRPPQDRRRTVARNGRVEGHVEGRVEGRGATLTRQLRRRFGSLPEPLEARLRTASPQQLELWTDRMLDARSLDEVFATAD
ncbi:MAG: DUF4351 domain-containing protein [Planctomycetes bacterium]|nr:DUF4351 domain-containing protein [Planctomycetota bacterium]